MKSDIKIIEITFNSGITAIITAILALIMADLKQILIAYIIINTTTPIFAITFLIQVVYYHHKEKIQHRMKKYLKYIKQSLKNSLPNLQQSIKKHSENIKWFLQLFIAPPIVGILTTMLLYPNLLPAPLIASISFIMLITFIINFIIFTHYKNYQEWKEEQHQNEQKAQEGEPQQ